MTLTYFCDIDIHLKENLEKSNSSETITATATLSCSHTALDAVGVDGICDLDLRKKVKTP